VPWSREKEEKTTRVKIEDEGGRKRRNYEGREGKGREGKGREGKGREGKGREGKGREGAPVYTFCRRMMVAVK
jgi:hypothetical protein